MYKTIEYTVDNCVAHINLNRPEVHNAFNNVMIDELLDVFQKIYETRNIRLAVLTGNGKSFCAGADLNWMREIINYSYEENINEALRLSELMYKIYAFPKPTIARVNGTAIGGGTGFVAVCDIVIAQENAKFGLSEVKLGLVPAVISPYVIKRMGESACRELFLTGERISAKRARELGLVNQVVPMEELDDAVDERINQLLLAGPKALATCKELLQKVPSMSLEEVKSYTAKVIASLRISDEGQEGMASFLEKRKPKWTNPETTD
ncbi:MAG TPA: enoyl-CoA hydratase/isomerase family protein [bacterium (Candidatus Stahlbacteria)]|nr:enoyl-CoA hydratase/isomerase family protein [Candidatus Stahlbacteria bacterium]